MVMALGLVGTFIIGIIVFGGGQVFIPLFVSLWQMMGVEASTIDSVLVVVNTTPGVVGTQLAFFTGYLIRENNWLGFTLMFVTYLLFFLPSLLMVTLAYKKLDKMSENKISKNIIVWMKPVIFGMTIALAVQLFIGAALPNLIFNDLHSYVGYDKNVEFFKGWRFIALVIYSVLNTIVSFYLYHKKKMNLLLLVMIQIALALLIFQPWLI